MDNNLRSLVQEGIKDISKIENLKDLEELKIKFMGKKGVITSALAGLKDFQGDKREIASFLNSLKNDFETAFTAKKEDLKTLELLNILKEESIDASLFSTTTTANMHPLTLMLDEIISFFHTQNFTIEFGPLVEDDFHNFEALNIPQTHPARDMQDTFYFNDSSLLRTHTSPVQIRTMLKLKSQNAAFPIKMIAPGQVFRRDYDLTHSPMFHQVEGLVVSNKDDKNAINFANLKDILSKFLEYIFGSGTKIRFRSSFFPFTEPSSEVDIGCIFCHGAGCRVCKHTGFLEVLGCGMVNDAVFSQVGYENAVGYAFGLGVERFAMLKYGVNDLRSFYENDFRLLEQF